MPRHANDIGFRLSDDQVKRLESVRVRIGETTVSAAARFLLLQALLTLEETHPSQIIRDTSQIIWDGNGASSATVPDNTGPAPTYPRLSVLDPVLEVPVLRPGLKDQDPDQDLNTGFVVRGGLWKPDPSKLAEWDKAYPEVEVAAELRRAAQWLRDNPSKAKTARGMPRYLGSWLSRAAARIRDRDQAQQLAQPKPKTASTWALAKLD